MKLVLFNIADIKQKSRYSSLGLAYIASYLGKYSSGVDTLILEGNVAEKLRLIKPDIIGIYAVTQQFNAAERFARKIREFNRQAVIILGGYHISALPHTLPEAFDIGVLGEGEETTRQLINLFNAQGWEKTNLRDIAGIVFREDGRITVNPQRSLIDDLDRIPFPNRALLSRTLFPNIITSRGCPYKCIFCASTRFWKKARFHSAEYVVSEIEELVGRYKAVHISIWDDLFIADKERFSGICDLISKRSIQKKVSFACALRSNLVDDKLCRDLKRMNITRVSLGFESGSERILAALKCGSVSVSDHLKAARLCKKYGFYVSGTFMIGIPGEQEDDLRSTLQLIRELKLPGGGNIALATAFPGTGFWDYAKARNLVSDNMDFSRLSVMTTDFSSPDKFSGILLSDGVPKTRFFALASQIQEEANKNYILGLMHKGNFSWRYLRLLFYRPRDIFLIAIFLVKSILQKKSALMGRYLYYKNNPDANE
ncbi:MAG: radical SAM protein [Candidatus Omnitrophica bacterium]|nr:radical SAM protein [Candidatus Omnitrophota bacterium]